MTKHEISQDELKELLEYSPTTGMFRWRFTIGRRRRGWWAGSLTSKGRYYCVRIGGKLFYSHRLAWIYVYGTHPDIVDHIDRDSLNNCIANLRSADHSRNMMNSKKRTDNKSGHRGIVWHQPTSQWYAYINANGIRYAKYYDDLDVALDFRNKMEAQLHKEFASKPSEQAVNAHAEAPDL